MRKLSLTLLAVASLALVGVSPALGHPPQNHLHCVVTPNGKFHSVARGVTFTAQHDPAFHNFHANVHIGPGLKHFYDAVFNPTSLACPTPPSG
jgi:hypothetical protein